MKADFTSKIRLANKMGTGFVKLPKNIYNNFDLHQNLEIFIEDNKFFAQIINWSGLGFYVPQNIVRKFIDKYICVEIRKIEDDYAKVGYDGRIYPSIETIKALKLKNNDIALIKIFNGNGVTTDKNVKIVSRKQTKDFMCMVGRNLAGKIIQFKLEKLKSYVPNKNLFSSFLEKSNFAINADGSIVIFSRKIPVVINPKIKLSDIGVYLGAYYSDGTKKGNNWAICASTFEQAQFYLKMHLSLIKNPDLEYVISYTDTEDLHKGEIKDNLEIIWKQNLGNYPYKFRIRKARGKCFLKCNKYGTLIIRQHRIGVLDIYNFLLKEAIKSIRNGNKKLAIDFICGILEGDGSVPARKHGHVTIATNKEEYRTIEEALKVIGIKSSTVWESPTRVFIRIGSLEILRNFDILKDKIFELYPKRRKALFERLQIVGAVKFILNQNHKAATWVKKWLRDNGFVNENYKLTKRGMKLKEALLNCMKSVVVK